eukprot:12890497-Prorocentrum_lima.AAC.1
MTLKSIVVQIGDDQGIQRNMYNQKYRWHGSSDIVDYVCGTEILGANSMKGRFLQTYRAMNHFPEGIDYHQHWV